MSTTKEISRQLHSLFSAPPPSNPSTSPTFPSLALPAETLELIDSQLAQFAASFPLGGGGGHHRDSEGVRARIKWRELLLELWATVEPLPGSEGDPYSIAKVSSFLELLGRLSFEAGEDDESAIISRSEVGGIWWQAVLKRVILGTPREKDDPSSLTSAPGKGRSSKTSSSASANPVSARPLTVSRLALEAVTKMVAWGMSRRVDDQANLELTAFGLTVWEEHRERATALLMGIDEGYGVRNLEECILGWADQSPQAFFHHIEPFLKPAGPARLSFLSLLLFFLTRHSGKVYHALKTPLLSTLTKVALTSPSPAIVTQATKSLSIFLVSLPVIIGDALIPILGVYGRIVSWEKQDDMEALPIPEANVEDPAFSEEAFVSPPPDPLLLFTVLYGVYPCNFSAFLKDAVGYLQEKSWKPPVEMGETPLISRQVRERSMPYVRLHTLHPSLFTSDAASELTDTGRWRNAEPADVRAECDRNLVQVAESRDSRGDINFGPLSSEAIEEEHLGRSRSAKPIDRFQDGQGVATPKNRSSSGSRSRTPLLPNMTHFTNFQILQQQTASSTPRRSGSPLAARPFDPLALSDEDFRRAALGLPSVLENQVIASSRNSSASASRRSSVVGSSALHSDAVASIAESKGRGSAQITRLETEILLLQGEVNFQTYLKQLHLAHMGTLHREKVLDSGAEAERQGLYRIIRTLRAQLKQTQSSLDKLRSEAGVTKANWISHIDDLREKLKLLREQKMKWDEEGRQLRAQVAETRDLLAKQGKELEAQGAAFFDLQNQVTLDAAKLARVTEYEGRIEALSKTLAVCDEDLSKFAEQRRDMDKLLGQWQKSEMLRDSVQRDVEDLKTLLRHAEEELSKERSKQRAATTTPLTPTPTSKDSLSSMRGEMERLRAKNLELEETARDTK